MLQIIYIRLSNQNGKIFLFLGSLRVHLSKSTHPYFFRERPEVFRMVTAMDEKMYEVLKNVFKHKDFKSDLQKRVVKCVLEGMYFVEILHSSTTVTHRIIDSCTVCPLSTFFPLSQFISSYKINCYPSQRKI